MAATTSTAATIDGDEALNLPSESLFEQVRQWFRVQFPWWASSCTLHIVGLCVLLLIGRTVVPAMIENVPAFDGYTKEAPTEAPSMIESLVLDQQFDPGKVLDVEGMHMGDPSNAPATDDALPALPPPGGGSDLKPPTPSTGDGTGFPEFAAGVGPKVEGDGRRNGGTGPGSSTWGTNGGPGGYGNRRIPGEGGGRLHGAGDIAVIAALHWLAAHQMPEGNWSLQDYHKQCKDRSCTGAGVQESFSGATGMGLLPFLAAGQTHKSGKYQPTVARGVYWLLSHQKANGDLSADALQQMYSHGLAAIALCECYGMTHDKTVGAAAQKAIDFIEAAQNTKTGGWRYHPGDDGDTSVLGWQMMALKSAEISELKVNPAALDGVKRWLQSVSKPAGDPNGASGSYGGMFAYQPDSAPSATMTAVGLLCTEYLHAGRADPVVVGGVQTLLANLPDDLNARNIYYWYYATQAMHNLNDRNWDTWNRKMRKILVDSQCRDGGCALGSWDPDKPSRDAWGVQGGRVMMTSFACLTLEVQYRYLPLYGGREAGGREAGGREAPAAEAKP